MAETVEKKNGDETGVGAIVTMLLPNIVGLAFGRAGLIVTSYGSYKHTDEGILTDGPMIVALLVMLVFFALLTATKRVLSKTWVNRIARACMVAEVASIFVIGCVYLANEDGSPAHFALNAFCTFVSSGSMFYWLRRMRGTETATAVVFVFSALVLSEVELYLTAQLSTEVGVFLASALAALQLPCMRLARGRTPHLDADELSRNRAFIGFDKEILKGRQSLIAMAIGIGLISIVDGFLRGYPDGSAIPFSPATRLAYGVLAVAVSIGIIAAAVHHVQRITSVGMFVAIELLACAALVCYAAFPDALEIGAVPTTTLNALLVGFVWYIIVAFMSYGWRDPYYYAMAGWFVAFGARACTRTLFLVISPLTENQPLAIAVTFACVVLSTQTTLLMFLQIEWRGDRQREEQGDTAPTIVRIMGLDEGKSLASMRQDAMRHSVEILGRQFLLSEREVDVLTLYALGFTQKKVAEELFITQSTAHAHIKRIYAKTGMHSRQEILDYIEEHAS